MGRKKFLPAPDYWKRHEQLYSEVFLYALQRLAETKCDISDEEKISEVLCIMLTKVCFEESKKRNYSIPVPLWEKPIQPKSSLELKGGKMAKRPDFTCTLVNPYACSSEDYELSLHIECKRLGDSNSRNWILNENYVVKGIMRFDSIEHEYGKRARSGFMIGYIISMTPFEILGDINIHHKKHCSQPANLVHQFAKKEVSLYRQRIKRCHVKPDDFDILHIWVDLKKLHYQMS